MTRRLLTFLQEATYLASKFPHSDYGKFIFGHKSLINNEVEKKFITNACRLVSQVTASVFDFDLPNSNMLSMLHAPVYYADVYESSLIHSCIFGFRKMQNIPLHDHPWMYGFIKVLRGSIKVETFSWIDKIPDGKEENCVAQDSNLIVRRGGNQILTPSDECAYFTPRDNNVHRITGMEDGATFFDLLVPGYGNHKCSYYEVRGDKSIPDSNDSNLCILREIPCPNTYFCDILNVPIVESL